jgi:Actin like proteins N terminal domain
LGGEVPKAPLVTNYQVFKPIYRTMTTTYFDTHDGHPTPLTAQTRLTQVVDPGNRFTKWLEGKAPRSIPSYIKQLADWEDGEPDSHSYIATLDGKRYAIGRLAQELGGKPAFEEGKADLAHLLVLPAIASNGCPLRIENLVIPTPDIRNRAVIQQLKKLENTLDFTLNGVDQVISIRQVRTVDECRGAYLLAKAQKLWKFPAHTNGVVDFGGGTAIARLFTPSGVLIREADVVLPGTYALAQKLAAALLPVLGQTPDLGLLMDAIAEGVYLYGTSGVNFAEAEIQRRLRAGHKVIALDPHAKYGGWRGCEVVGAGMAYEDINQKLGWVAAEIKHRYELIAKQPDPKFTPLTVICDEFTNWAGRCENSAEFFKAALSDIRKAACYVLIVSHTRTLPGLGDAKGMASLRDAALLEIELLGQVDPTTGKAVPRFEAWIKLPGQGQGDRTLVKIPKTEQRRIDPREHDRDYFERTYQLEFELTPFEPLEPSEPTPEPLNRLDSEASSDSDRRFTPLGLSREQAIQLVKSLRTDLNLTQTIERLWQVSKGGSEGWKKAREEYRELMGE